MVNFQFLCFFFFFKQKTAYEMRIRDWSSDVCSSDLLMFHAMKNAEHVDIQGSLEIGARQLMKRHVDRRQPRIVECAIKATEFGDGEFHGRPRVVLDTDVAMAVDG